MQFADAKEGKRPKNTIICCQNSFVSSSTISSNRTLSTYLIQAKKTNNNGQLKKNVRCSVLNVWLLQGKTRVGCPLSQKEQQKVLSVYQKSNEYRPDPTPNTFHDNN